MTAMISDSSPGAGGRVTPPQRFAGREVVRGREADQKMIADLLRRAERGAGGVVLVDGEPGIGKSLLLQDAADEAAELGFSLAAGAADQLGEAIPFFALRTALGEPFARFTGDYAGRDGPAATAWWMTRIRAHLEQRAAAAPVLVCLDDLHWASPATLAALRALPRDLKRYPVAWLLARSITPQRAADYMFALLETDGAGRVTLAPLHQDAVAAMLTDAFGAPPEQSLADLAAGAAGNPSLVAELIDGLREDHAVQVTGGRAVLASAGLPQRIHRLAQWRLDGLSKQARQLLVTVSVLGPAFRLEDAAEMLGETPATLLPAVQEAMDAAIITAAEHAFAFRHQLLRRSVGEMIPRPARRALHRQYGEILLTRGESAALAASHLLLAAYPGDPASLAGLDQAAAQTLRSAPQTAAGLALRALQLTSAADPVVLSRAVAAAEALTAAGRLDEAARIARDMLARPLPSAAEDRLRCALSSVLCARGQARDAADQARLLLARPQLPGDLRDLALTAQLQALAGLHDELAGPVADAILATPGQHDCHAAAAARLTRAVISWDSGRIGDGLELLRDAARYGTGISPDARHVQPLLALAAALVDLRQLGEAADMLRAADNPASRNIPAEAALCLLRARIHLAAGQLADAAADARAALAVARTLGARGYAATAHRVLSVIELRRGDIAAAAKQLTCGSATGPQLADIYARPETTAAEAQITEARDGPAAVLDHLRQRCADLEARPGFLLGDPALSAWLVRTALAAGDSELAARMARVAETLADAHPGFPALAVAAAHSGGLLRRDLALLTQAAAQHCDPWARASAAEDLGVLHGRQGDRDHAIRHLKEALSGYAQVGADRDQARIRRRLRKLGIRRRQWATPAARPVTGWGSLTATEQAVAYLVAEGLNNSQVAARLYISSHTVAHHLRQAFRKLSISSRVALTRIVIEQAGDGSLMVRLPGRHDAPALSSRPHHQGQPFSALAGRPGLVVRLDDVPRPGPADPQPMGASGENVYDVIVIGAGPVGYTVAGQARVAGLSVAAVERELVGGECSYWACIPSKAMLRPVVAVADARRVAGARQAVTGPVSAPAVFARRDGYVTSWNDEGQAAGLKSTGAELIRGHGRLDGHRRVAVVTPDGGTVALTARQAVVICTGSRPDLPELAGLAEVRPWTNRQATDSHTVPRRLAIVGGGGVGVEMASAWAGLGSAVTLLAQADGLLPRMEPFAGELIAGAFTDAGIDVRIGVTVTGVRRPGGTGPVTVTLEGGGEVEADEVLFATGRQPLTDDIGLDTVGLEPGAWLDVDDTCMVRALGDGWLYALGDINHHALLTHQGKYQARIAGAAIAARAGGLPIDPAPWGPHAITADYLAVPQVFFCDPPAGAVGLTADQAERAGHHIRVVDVDLGQTVPGAGLYADGYTGRARMVADEDHGYLLGVTFVGPGVEELIHSATIAVAGQVPISRLWHAVPCFPSISEVWLRLLEAYRT